MDDEVEVVRWYTGTRHIPTVVGKFHTGEPIPFGPYTIAQIFTALGLFLALWLTKGTWSTSNGATNLVVLFGVPGGATWLVKKVPWNARNPLTTAAAIPAAFGAGQGRYRDKTVKVAKTHTEAPVALLDLDLELGSEVAASAAAPAEAPVEAAAEPVAGRAPEVARSQTPGRAVVSEPEPMEVNEVPRSAVQALLAGAARRS